MFVTVSYNIVKTIILMIAFFPKKKYKIKIYETQRKRKREKKAVGNSCTIIIAWLDGCLCVCVVFFFTFLRYRHQSP